MIRLVKPRVLAVSSGGGHWVQLLRMRPAFADREVAYVTVQAAYAEEVPEARLYVVPDATRWDRLAMVHMILKLLLIILRERPAVVISTGAAPGYFAIRMARLLGARTVWLDSIANVEELSMAGRMVGPYADLWLTQWPELATDQGPRYIGSVL